MEWLEVADKVVTMVAVPLLGVFLFYDSRKRKEAAEATKAEAENISRYAAEWKELYEKKEEEREEAVANARTEIEASKEDAVSLGRKIDELYREKNGDRARILELMEENARLKLYNQGLEFLKCEISMKCAKKVPPNEFAKQI